MLTVIFLFISFFLCYDRTHCSRVEIVTLGSGGCTVRTCRVCRPSVFTNTRLRGMVKTTPILLYVYTFEIKVHLTVPLIQKKKKKKKTGQN
jgi:hypothetical protein